MSLVSPAGVPSVLKRKELSGRRVASPAVVSPGSDSWSAQRLVIHARQGAALIKLLICLKSLEDDAVAIRHCDF